MSTTIKPEITQMAQSIAEAFCKDQDAAWTLYDLAQEDAKSKADNYSEWTDKDKMSFAIRYAMQYGAAVALHCAMTEAE